MKIILSVIAVCLVMITVKLYSPIANADVDRYGRDHTHSCLEIGMERSVKGANVSLCNFIDHKHYKSDIVE